MTTQVWIAVLVGLAATVDDLVRRQIANWIPAAALAGGFGWQIGQDGWMGALHALAGAAAGFAVFLVFYLLGGMGGGDVKLMAGFGALLGTGRLIEACAVDGGRRWDLGARSGWVSSCTTKCSAAVRIDEGSDGSRKRTRGFDSLRAGNHDRRMAFTDAEGLGD